MRNALGRRLVLLSLVVAVMSPGVRSDAYARTSTDQRTSQPGTVQDVAIVSVDERTQRPLAGACFIISSTLEACDEDGDGQVDFRGVIPGQYTVTETQAPFGYEVNGDFTMIVQSDQPKSITVPHVPLEPANDPMTSSDEEPPAWAVRLLAWTELTPELLEESLPQSVGEFTLVADPGDPARRQHLHPNALESTNFIYQDPSAPEVPFVVNVSRFRMYMNPNEAITEIVRETSAESDGFEVEQQRVGSSGDVAYLLAREAGDTQTVYALLWGANTSNTVFTIFAPSPDLRKVLTVRLGDRRVQSATQEVRSEQADPDAIARALQFTPFPEHLLPVEAVGAEVLVLDEPVGDETVHVDVDVTSPFSQGSASLSYAIFASAEEAQQAHAEFLDYWSTTGGADEVFWLDEGTVGVPGSVSVVELTFEGGSIGPMVAMYYPVGPVLIIASYIGEPGVYNVLATGRVALALLSAGYFHVVSALGE